MSATCEAKRIQQNSAQQVLDQAQQALKSSRADYLACQGPQAQGAAALATAKGDMDKAVATGQELLTLDEIILGQLSRGVAHETTIRGATTNASEEINNLSREVNDLKSQIRTQRRRFLDSGPQNSVTGPTGLYFTQESDNQVLIAFMSCYGAFLLVVGLFVWMNHIPIQKILVLTVRERTTFVLSMWGIGIAAAAVGLVLFT